jgi:hypothetical protein
MSEDKAQNITWSVYLDARLSARLEQMRVGKNLSKSAVAELMISRGMAVTEEHETQQIALWGQYTPKTGEEVAT